MSEENMPTGNEGHLVSLGERLRQAADEIDNIKNSFAKNTEDLSRIKNMLDVGSLDEINGIIEKFEGQITESERKKEEAFEGAKKYSDELEKEKERLIKLWDAYKNQEEELTKTETKLEEYKEKVENAEDSEKQLSDSFNTRIDTLTQKLKESEGKINQFEEYKKSVDEFASIRNQLEEENLTFKDDIKNKESTINMLQVQVEKLKDFEKYSEYKDKFNDLSNQYEKEKERLAKLYKLYEETEGECSKLKKETKDWQNWFDSNKEIFDKLFSTSPPTGTLNVAEEHTTTSIKDEPKNSVQEIKNENNSEKTKPKNKKKKLRFIK